MTLPQCWLDLEKAVVLQQVVDSANNIFTASGDVRAKQKEVQHLFTELEMNREPFECIYSELDDAMDETELESFLAVWKVEVTMAAQDAAKGLQSVGEANGFHLADIEVMSDYTKCKMAVRQQKRKMSEAVNDVDEEQRKDSRMSLYPWKTQWM